MITLFDYQAMEGALRAAADNLAEFKRVNAVLTIERDHAMRRYSELLGENLALRKSLVEAQEREVARLNEDCAELRAALQPKAPEAT